MEGGREGEVEGKRGGEVEVEGGEGKRGGVEKGGEVEVRKNEMHNRHSPHTQQVKIPSKGSPILICE